MIKLHDRQDTYRWNPFEKRWEYWSCIHNNWRKSTIYGFASVDIELQSNVTELLFMDTWAEPTHEDQYNV